MSNRVKGLDEVFCSSCGEIIKREAELCPKCGVRQRKAPSAFTSEPGKKNIVVTLLLCLIGVHRFYTGKIGTGVLFILTFGGFLIWYLIDLITIVMGRFTDSDGNVISWQ